MKTESSLLITDFGSSFGNSVRQVRQASNHESMWPSAAPGSYIQTDLNRYGLFVVKHCSRSIDVFRPSVILKAFCSYILCSVIAHLHFPAFCDNQMNKNSTKISMKNIATTFLKRKPSFRQVYCPIMAACTSKISFLQPLAEKSSTLSPACLASSSHSLTTLPGA